jgi:hypothetical protein
MPHQALKNISAYMTSRLPGFTGFTGFTVQTARPKSNGTFVDQVMVCIAYNNISRPTQGSADYSPINRCVTRPAPDDKMEYYTMYML